MPIWRRRSKAPRETEMLIWYGGGLIAAIFIAWIAAIIHASGNAPLGLVSLGIGVGLGAAIAGLGAILRIAGGRRLIIGTILLAIVTVLAEHAWLYVDFRRQWHEARLKSPVVAMFRPESPWSPAEYFTHEWTPRQAALWCLDAGFIVAGAVGTVFALRRLPS